MASLQNEQIDQSYQGLIKTADNTSTIPFPAQNLQFGDGTAFPIEIADLSAFGAGTSIALKSGTNQVAVDGTGFVIDAAGGTMTANAGTVVFKNGTYNFGDAGPATNVDFTNATVTGLPSGSAGLENGTGADSLQSAAALTTTAADAAGSGSIALGDGASATRQESVAIGQGALANGTGSEGSIAIGHGSVASANRGIAIGINGTTNSSEGIVIGDDVDISGSDRSVGIGNSINLSGGNDKVAIGTSASVTGQRGLAFGQNASATATEAIAMGYNVTAATANTLSVNALETQADGGVSIKGDGTNAGKLKLYCEDAAGTHNVTLEGPAHAGGASYSLKLPNVQSAGTQILEADSSGNLAWIDTPSGGGGGAAQAFSAIGASAMKGVVPYNENAGQQFKTNQMLSGYGSTTAGQNNDAAMWQLVPLAEGNTISKLLVSVAGALAGGTAEVAFYDTDVDSDGFIYVKDRLLSLGTVDCSTTGDKIITLGTPFTMPSGKVNGQIAVLAFRSDNAIGMRGWSQTVFSGWGGSMQNTTYYRAMSPTVKPGVAPGVALPATIGDKSTANVTYGAQTSNPLMVMWI